MPARAPSAARREGPALGARAGDGGRAARWAAVALLVLAPAATADPVRDPGCGEMLVPMRANAVVYPLPRGFLRADSDSAWVGSRAWRRGVDYLVDRLRGEIRLLRDPVPGDTIHLRACWLLAPPPLELQLVRYRPVAVPGADTAAAPGPRVPRRAAVGRAVSAGKAFAARDPESAAAGASLNLSGNKTIAVDFGSNQDAFLRQSLDLTVSGSLAPGVELTGVLSDRNAPLTAAGTTQSIEALDRVLIELKAPRGNAALGDVGLDLRQGEFGRLERRLQGMRAEWRVDAFQLGVAAASAPGEFHRLQFFGVEGRQGPYLLSDRSGGLGISVVAGSEVVTVDGARMTRGESADYSIDYERARVTFSNRRPISSASRITVDYQYTVNRFRRNLLAAGGRWERDGRYGFVQGFSEGDDRGRPLDVTLSADDRLRLAAAGDSALFAIGDGVTPGGGDYDTVRVDSSRVAFAFAGEDAGEFTVRFARVGEGRGDYADSSVVAGRTVYRFVGEGRGSYRVGRLLPLPESHQLWSAGGGLRAGILAVEIEGAVSRRDRNVFSPADDADNQGEAGRAEVRLEGDAPGPWGGKAGLILEGRAVGEGFAPFGRLERPFAQEDWGLPPAADLERQRRVGATGYFRPGAGGELRASVARLRLPGGFRSLRRDVEWAREGAVATRLRVERSDGEQEGLRFADGGRERFRGDLRWRLEWLEPSLRAESDERRFPSDTGRVGERTREAGLGLQSGRAIPWRLAASYDLRREATATAARFADRSEIRTVRIGMESPPGSRAGVGLTYQRRDLERLDATERTRSDLGGLRLRGEDPGRGLSARLDLEVTSEGDNRRLRRLTFVGPGRGTYDALGNFVGVGDYDLVVVVSPELERVGRASTSGTASWTFGRGETWRGSRVEFDYETEARRRGQLRAGDLAVSPGVVIGDPGLARASVVQRLEADLAPGSRSGALRLRGERRVSGDRSFESFSQSLDERTLSARWRARPGAAVTTEVELRLRRRTAEQAQAGGGAFRRALVDDGGTGQLVFTPDARLRVAAALEATWSRPEGRAEATRTIRVGPDLGMAVGTRGRVEAGIKRSFVNGPPVVGLLPSADPPGAPTWEGSTRLDYRVRDGATLAISMTGRDRPGRGALLTGRAELRAFF